MTQQQNAPTNNQPQHRCRGKHGRGSHRARKILALLAVVGLGTGIVACRGWRHMSPDERAAFAVEKATDKLDLNTEQQATLKVLADEALALSKEMRSARRQERDWVMAQVGGDALDQARILELLDAHQARIRDRAPGLVAKLAAFHATLSTEQKAEATELLRKFQKHFGADEDDTTQGG